MSSQPMNDDEVYDGPPDETPRAKNNMQDDGAGEPEED